MENFILTYYQQIKEGSVSVNNYIRTIYEYIVNGLETGQFRFDAKKANSQIRFIEEHCHHTEGRLAPGLFKLEIWQKAAVSAIFGIVDDKGLRQFREIVMVEGRKCGKSLLGASIGECVLFNDGEYGARGFCVAPKLDQADIIYSTMWASISLDPELREKTKHRKSDLYIEESNSTFKKIAFNAKKSDGFNPSICICDEFASWPAEQGLKQYEVMKSAMGAREQPIMLAISTAGYVNDGIYDELMKRCTSFLMGNSKETRLLPLLYTIDDLDKWNDINELHKSMPNLGVSVSYDYMLEEIAIAEGSLSKKTEFLCKYCNIKQNSSTAWLDTRTIDKCIGEELDLESFRGSYCVGGIDLSRTTDLTACAIVIEKEGRLFVFAKFFLPKEKIDEATARDGVPYRAYIQRGLLQESGDNFVDYHDCYTWFCDLVEKYEILPLSIGYDRYNSLYLTQDMKTYGFHMDDVYQGENLSPVIDELEGLMKDGKICIGNNDLMKIHLLDSALKQNSDTMRKKLIKVAANVHIDGTAALLDAMTVRQKWYSEIGSQLRNG
jgi:phage terminase large subunit-like protein